METTEREKRKGLASYFAAVLTFWGLALALAGILAVDDELLGGCAFFVLGALLLGGPFLFVELCDSPTTERFWQNAGPILGTGFVGTLVAISGLYWAIPGFWGVWFATRRKTTALGPRLRRQGGRILTATVATAFLLAACSLVGNVAPGGAFGIRIGFGALFLTLAVFYAAAAFAFAAVAFKTANVDAETTCVNGDDGVSSVAVEAKEPREIGLGFYFAAVAAFLALALGLRFEGNFLSVWLLANAPFFCVTLCDRRLWRAWPLSLVATVFIPVLALGCVWASVAFLQAGAMAFGLGAGMESLNGLIACFAALVGAGVAATLFGVWLASTLKTAPDATAGETLARRRGRILTAVGIFALVETALYVGGAIGEEHFFCSLGVALFETPTFVLHWSALGVLAFWPRRRNDGAGKNEPRDWGEFYRRISKDNVDGGRAETLGSTASE
ncbi:MAG: hypothetical protein J6K25_04080 [Thermoguttaceae bacterium]|nr:hypothetical protein [Thermoguttaceae bacterium]